MGLTIPKAGVQAGRAPQLASVPVPSSDLGGAVAGFGERMLRVGSAIEEERRGRELDSTRVEIMNGMNDLRLKYEQVGDPDQIDQGFSADANALRDGILAKVDPRNQEAVGQMFDETNISHSMAIGARAIDLRQSARIAQLDATTESAVQIGATADPQVQATTLGQLDDQLSGLVANGTLTPEQAQQRRATAASSMDDARATRLLSDNPSALVADIDAGKFGYMGAERAQAFRARAVSAVASAESAMASEAARAQKERLGQASDLFKDGATVFGRGRAWARMDEAEALLENPEFSALPEAREYAQAKLLHELAPEFAALPMAEKRRVLSEAEAVPIEKGYDANLVDAMRKQIASDEKGWDDDRFAHAAEIGLTPANPLPDPASATAEDAAAALRGRAHYARSLAESGHTDDVKYFSPDEAEDWKAAVAEEKSPEERAKLATAFASALGTDAEAAASEIGADPLFTYVGGLVAHTGQTKLARQIFEGQRAIANSDTRMPAAPMRRDNFFREFSGLFEDGTMEGRADEAGVRNQIIDAADALYAYRRRGDPKGSDAALNEDVYLQAVHEVMGGTGSYDEKSARGGIQRIRDRLTILPPNLNSRDVERSLDDLVDLPAGSDKTEAVFRDIAASGNAPRAGGQPITPNTLKGMSLRQIQGSVYEMVFENPTTGQISALYGDDGAPYLLDITKLTDKFGGNK